MNLHPPRKHPLTIVKGTRVDAGVRLCITQASVTLATLQRGQLSDDQVLERLDRATFHLIQAARYMRDPRGKWDLT